MTRSKGATGVQNEDTAPNLYRAHATLYTLLYPAFLGTIIVVVFTANRWPEVFANGWALAFLLLYFASQHVVNAVDFKNYSWPMFVADFLELALLIYLFGLLGAFDKTPTFKIEDPGDENCFFAMLAVCLLLPVYARGFTLMDCPIRKGRDGLLSILSIIAAGVAISGIWILPDNNYRWFILIFLLIFYFATGVFQSGFSSWFLEKVCREGK